eukprot:Rhum_TRINITY_DN18698_c0_g1::Rhum_TRINITY_DN18698_c0_g1_i1::g.168126::m.168126
MPAIRPESQRRLVGLNVAVDSANKQIGAQEADRATQDGQANAEQQHVAKVEARHEQPVHLCLEHEKIGGVDEDVTRRRSTQAERRPLPPVVFGVQQVVRVHHGKAHRHRNQDHVHQQHEPVHVVELVVPEGREHKVQLDEDGPEGKDPTGKQEERTVVPPLLRYPPRNLRHPRLLGALLVTPDEGSCDDQRQGHEDPPQNDANHRHEGNGLLRRVRHGKQVQQEDHRSHDAREQRCRVHHRCLPVLGNRRTSSGVVDEEACRRVPCDAAGDGVRGHAVRQKAAALRVDDGGDGDEDQAEAQHGELRACAHERAQQNVRGRHAEHVAVHLLPAALVELRCVVLDLLVVARVVGLESAQQHNEHDARQHEHHHERVQHRHPVDRVLKEGLVQVPTETVLERHLAGLPFDVVGEGDVSAVLGDLDLALCGEVGHNDAVPVVAEAEALVCVEVGNALLVDLAQRRPRGQVVDVQLVPVLLLHRVAEHLCVRRRQLLRADRRPLHLLLELQLHVQLDELVARERLTDRQRLRLLVRRFAPRKDVEVPVRLERVVERADLVPVHVQPVLVAVLVVRLVATRGRREGEQDAGKDNAGAGATVTPTPRRRLGCSDRCCHRDRQTAASPAPEAGAQQNASTQ